jgi:hypothetical protein
MAQCGVAMGENNGTQWRPVIEPSAHDASKYFRRRQKTTPPQFEELDKILKKKIGDGNGESWL